MNSCCIGTGGANVSVRWVDQQRQPHSEFRYETINKLMIGQTEKTRLLYFLPLNYLQIHSVETREKKTE